MTDATALVHRWFEDLFSEGELSVADEILAPDVEYHGPESVSPGNVVGVDAIREYVTVYRESFPDITYVVVDVFESGDRVCARWRAEGTYEDTMHGVSPEGTTFSGDGINVFHVTDDRITEVWSAWDTLEMSQELDIVPPITLLSGR